MKVKMFQTADNSQHIYSLLHCLCEPAAVDACVTVTQMYSYFTQIFRQSSLMINLISSLSYILTCWPASKLSTAVEQCFAVNVLNSNLLHLLVTGRMNSGKEQFSFLLSLLLIYRGILWWNLKIRRCCVFTFSCRYCPSVNISTC